MNLAGMGLMELGVVLLVAFLVLGPNRSIELVRAAGRAIGELRRSFAEIASSVGLEQTDQDGIRRPGSAPGAEDDPAGKD